MAKRATKAKTPNLSGDLYLVPFQFNEFYFAGFVCCGT
jgi:hypothetical protein